jgi:uncharacterized membrane protein YbhN (UPF0104 family)
MAVSLILIGLLIYNVEWESFLNHFKTLSIWPIVIVLAVFTIQFPISAMKWKTALAIHQLDYSFGFLLKVICIGFFFNNFLPTSIGGDAYRVIRTVPEEGFKSRAVSAVLLERIIGFAALLLLGFVGGVLTLTLVKEQNQLVLYYVLICAIGGMGVICMVILLWLGVFSTLLKRIKNIKKLEILTHNLGHIWRNPGLLINVSMTSLLFQVLAVIAISVLFDALGGEAGYAKYALMAAVVGLASVLPISINGIGVVEGAFVFSATQLGIGYNEAIIAAFMLRILVIPLSLICGFVYLWEMRRK